VIAETTMQSIGMINNINLCDSCRNEFATCKAKQIIWGTGKGNDNVSACHIYKPLKYGPRETGINNLRRESENK